MTRGVLALAAGLVTLGCGGFETPPPERPSVGGDGGDASSDPAPSRAACPADDDDALPGTHPVGIHVDGNRLVDADGKLVFLRGVNRSGSEYRCIQGGGFFDGACDEASVRAMKTWNVNAVRVPLNESCWLSINGAPRDFSGEHYHRAIRSYVHLLHKYELVPILELHWSRSGDQAANRLDPMPNVDHSQSFWREVARTFADDDGVIFEPFNEPFPDRNRDTPEAWRCWRDGCVAQDWDEKSEPYQAAGMQTLVDAIRETGARQLILLGGVMYSNALGGWLEHQPHDPLGNIAPAWHIYNFNACSNEACWSGAPLELAQQLPIVATEIGQDDCGSDFISPLMSFLDRHGAGYLAWSWNVQGKCEPAMRALLESPGNPWPLISDFKTAAPNSPYAEAFRDHVLAMTR